MYTIYTDGACSGNPGPGGWGFVVVNENDKQMLRKSGGEKNTTNNKMELVAFLKALEWFAAEPQDNILNIYVDSAYIYNCFNDMWYIRWRTNGWKNANKKPIANREVWEQILEIYLTNQERINIFKVSGHTGNKWNEYVDNLAVKAAKEIVK